MVTVAIVLTNECGRPHFRKSAGAEKQKQKLKLSDIEGEGLLAHCTICSPELQCRITVLNCEQHSKFSPLPSQPLRTALNPDLSSSNAICFTQACPFCQPSPNPPLSSNVATLPTKEGEA